MSLELPVPPSVCPVIRDRRLFVSKEARELGERLDDDHAKLMERVDDFSVGLSVRHYLHGGGFHFHLDFPSICGGIGQNNGPLTACGLLLHLPHKPRQTRFLLNEGLNLKCSKELADGNRQLDRQEALVLVFIDEGIQNSQRFVPGLSSALVRLHRLNRCDCIFRDTLQRPAKSISALARVSLVDGESGGFAPESWIGEPPYDVIKSRSQVRQYIAHNGRKGDRRRLGPNQDPVAVAYGNSLISWRVHQHAIRMAIGISGDENAQVSEMGFRSPDLLSGAGLGWVH